MNLPPHPSPARLMARLSTGAGASLVLYGPGLLIRHDSSLRAALNCRASFSAATASCVNVRRKKASSAARAGSFEVFAMTRIVLAAH